MKSTAYLLVIAFMMLITSCNQSDEKKQLVHIPEGNPLQGETLFLNVAPYEPNQLILHDSLLIISNNRGDVQPWLYVYQATDPFSLLGTIGQMGNGPGEFPSLQTMEQIETRGNTWGLWCYDM